MLAAAGGYVYARRLYAAVAEQVRKFGEVAFERIEYFGEEVAEIVREHLARRDSGLPAYLLHLRPYAVAAQRLPVSVAEYRAVRRFLRGGVAQELFYERGGEEYAAAFAFEPQLGASSTRGLHRDEGELGYADTGRAYGLHREAKAFVPFTPRRLDELHILSAPQLAAFIAEGGALALEKFCSPVRKPSMGQHPIDG